jgi:hypothetical protein
MGLPARSRIRVGASCVGAFLLAILATSGPASAAPKPITGKLSKPGYTVIALAPNGRATAVRASQGRFRLRPPARSVTLHLRAPNGVYAGPIVVGRSMKGRRAIVGIKAGARLGRVSVRGGYARVARRLPQRWVDARRTARARRGVPIGARAFGRVLSQPPRNPIPGDSDFDGVPDPLDIDDDGDLILDSLDRPTTLNRPNALSAAQQVLDSPMLNTSLELSLTETVNANAGSTDQQIEQTPFAGVTQIKLAALNIGFPPAASTELDCGRDDPKTPALEGLSYCRPGGSGRIFPSGPMQPGGEEFPECCDPDKDGFGTLVPAGPNSGAAMALVHGATTTQMKTGDVLIKRINDANGVEIASFSHTLQYVFATVPALVSYDDGAGHSASVSYPIAAGEPPPGTPGGPGTSRNAFPVAPRPAGDPAAGDVLVTLTLWQPQRRPILGEPGYSNPPTAWTDIGGLTHSVTVETPHDGSTNFQYKECPQDAYSATPDQPFSLPAPPAGPGLTDTLADRPAHPGNRLTYTLNLTKCNGGTPWSSGQVVSIHIRASGLRTRLDSAPGFAAQTGFSFELE